MLLCRFVLAGSPGVPRSGLYFDGRFYETDGERPVGVHEPSAVRLLCPVGPPAAMRLMSQGADGSWGWEVADPLGFAPSGSHLDSGPAPDRLAVEVRLAAVVNESEGGLEDPAQVVLGFTLVASLLCLGTLESAKEAGLPGAAGRALGCWAGPFVATPDTVEEMGAGLTVPIGAVLAAGPEEFEIAQLAAHRLAEVVAAAHRLKPLRGGELIAAPGHTFEPGSLAPGSRVRLDAGVLGVLVGHVA